jgi:hypothetical protein
MKVPSASVFLATNVKEIRNLSDLVGETLSEVRFVMDYIQLGFSGPLLTCYSHPVMYVSETAFIFPSAGSRDTLCAFIGRKLQEITLEENREIRLAFEIGAIVIPLDGQNRKFGDAAEFLPSIGEPIQDF